MTGFAIQLAGNTRCMDDGAGQPSWDATFPLPPSLDAPALARRYVVEHAANLPENVVEDAVLLVSELVTNAVRHGHPNIFLRLRIDPPRIGVAVEDRGEALPVVPPVEPDPTVPSGRGLLIVDAMATAWGVDPAELSPGKIVWFELDPS
jgi:anti-sigma regulatory factor (Ser/Thr protein kinase)